MRVVVTGGTGLIGSALTRSLVADGHAVAVLTRHAGRAHKRLPAAVQVVAWDARSGGVWEAALDGADAVVNLAGEPIATSLWTAGRRRHLRDSRINATRAIVAALARPGRPRVLVNASAVGYYGDGGDAPLPETAPPGSDFLASVVVDWEREARGAEAYGVRVALIRTGIVLAAEGGALLPIALAHKLFLGGTLGRPNQWVSWIHLTDEIGLIRLALDKPAVSGPLNAVAPEPVTMQTLCQAVGRILRRPSWLPGAAVGMKLLLREHASAMLASQKAVPVVAQRLNYQFMHPAHEAALRAALLKEPQPAASRAV